MTFDPYGSKTKTFRYTLNGTLQQTTIDRESPISNHLAPPASDRILSGFLRADPDDILDGEHENLAVPHLTGLRGLDDRVETILSTIESAAMISILIFGRKSILYSDPGTAPCAPSVAHILSLR